ncbi:unnamed protein product [Phytophthora fragariaefolia]|uniref:Unnamed protein product n=1 Tax=Phytophthora fragariaefolia TaxID=1490495 RepID=A0A9W7D7Z9_9STRA|nr:unnamed protein product [Phytophthora fragariaefolia]
MAPRLALSLGFGEREETPSILAYAEDAGQDDFDDWCEQRNSATPRWRNSCPDKTSTTTASRWSSRLTSLSTGIIGASTALTTRAKQLCVGESAHRAVNQLRKSMVEATSSRKEPRRTSVPTHHRFSESDIECFASLGDQPEAEKTEDEKVVRGKESESKSRRSALKNLKPTRPWSQGCTS